MDDNAKAILEFSKQILEGKRDHSFADEFIKQKSARCIEIPWVASQIKKYYCKYILDIGISLASLDYLGLLLELKKRYNKIVESVDIIKPQRVEQRYPLEWLKYIYRIPIVTGDIREVEIPKNRYDMVTCISVIEHIGYDKPANSDVNSAFARARQTEDVVKDRPSDTNKKVLDKICYALKDGGILLITVPMGKGGPILLQDSLGYYCVQWEYEKVSWQEILNHPSYKVVEQHFFKLTPEYRWIQVEGVEDLSNQKSCIKSHSNGCALLVLKKS